MNNRDSQEKETGGRNTTLSDSLGSLGPVSCRGRQRGDLHRTLRTVTPTKEKRKEREDRKPPVLACDPSEGVPVTDYGKTILLLNKKRETHGVKNEETSIKKIRRLLLKLFQRTKNPP